MNQWRVIQAILLLGFVCPIVIVGGGNFAELNPLQTEQSNNLTTHDKKAVQEAENLTVVTNHFNSETNGSITAFNDDKEVLYKNRSLGRYFDVDPSTQGDHTVLYVGSQILDNSYCKLPNSDRFACVRNVVERLNFTTGESKRLYSYELSSRHPDDSIHDIDRINETHLLVADIFRNRAFIVNTSSEIVTWSWRVASDYSFRSGGDHDDWTHINDVEYLEERDLIMVDLRNQDEVAFIDKQRGLLPNLTLGEDGNHSILYEQHNPDYIPEEQGGPAVVVADSENNRIVEYQRANRTWERSWTWSDESMEWPRDADRLPNGHTLITDTHSDRVFELNQQGNITGSLQFPEGYEAERLSTGDESGNGESAQSLDLPSQDGGNNTSNGPTPLQDARVTIREFIPNKLFHGLMWVLPTWMDFADVILLVASLVSGSVLFIANLYHTDVIDFQAPIKLNR
jgi:hypothetical protein